MSVPAVRRIVVGVDGSAESVAALRWACREASLRGAEVHAVHVREEHRHSLASYAVTARATEDEITSDVDDLVRSVGAGQAPGVHVRFEEVDGLAARVLLDRCAGTDMAGTDMAGADMAGADMLVLGTPGDEPGALRSAGPVIRACLRRAPCPVVVISAAQDPAQRREPAARAAEVAGAGAVGTDLVKVPAAAGI